MDNAGQQSYLSAESRPAAPVVGGELDDDPEVPAEDRVAHGVQVVHAAKDERH